MQIIYVADPKLAGELIPQYPNDFVVSEASKVDTISNNKFLLLLKLVNSSDYAGVTIIENGVDRAKNTQALVALGYLTEVRNMKLNIGKYNAQKKLNSDFDRIEKQ